MPPNSAQWCYVGVQPLTHLKFQAVAHGVPHLPESQPGIGDILVAAMNLGCEALQYWYWYWILKANLVVLCNEAQHEQRLCPAVFQAGSGKLPPVFGVTCVFLGHAADIAGNAVCVTHLV